MTEPFIGEIQIFGFDFPARNWAYCNGAVLSIAQNTALFSLLGTTYGGNGSTTFALPNFSSRAVASLGQGAGLTPRVLGEDFGAPSVTLNSSQIPAHQHALVVFAQNDPTKRAGTPSSGNALSVSSSSAVASFSSTTPNTSFASAMVQPSPGGAPHENRQPYLGVNFCIALQGIYPSRN